MLDGHADVNIYGLELETIRLLSLAIINQKLFINAIGEGAVIARKLEALGIKIKTNDPISGPLVRKDLQNESFPSLLSIGNGEQL